MRLGEVTRFVPGPKPQLCPAPYRLVPSGATARVSWRAWPLRWGVGGDIRCGGTERKLDSGAQGAWGKMEEAIKRGHIVQGLEGWTDRHVQGLWRSPTPPDPAREGAGKGQGWRPNVQPKIGSCCQRETNTEPGFRREATKRASRGHEKMEKPDSTEGPSLEASEEAGPLLYK